MRKILLAALLLLMCQGASAQLIQFGVKAGLSTTQMKLKSTSIGNYNFDTDSRLGFHVGIMSRINLLALHIQPELLYSHNSYKFFATNTGASPVTTSKSTVNLQSLDVPVLVGLKLLFLRINAGPVFNIMNQGNNSSGSFGSVALTKSSVSYMLGLGLDISKINIDVRYHGQFSKPIQNISMGDIHGELKSGMGNWMFSVGYMF